MAPSQPELSAGRGSRALGAACVTLAIAAYYWLYFLPPRLLGSSDPDRYYHLGLSKIVAASGLPRTLPQVDDLGWGAYFPDKEFLFHVLTGTAWSLGESSAVLWLVPVLGVALVLCLYAELCRQLRPAHAALLAIACSLLTVGFMFRISLLRPHLLAMLIFCSLLLALLRQRPRLAALTAALFALSYHAFYVILVVVAASWLLRREPGMAARAWAWCLAGLVAGLVLNPYFPSNLEIGLLTLRIALGLESSPQLVGGPELAPLAPMLLLLGYGFLPLALIATAAGAWWRKPAPSPERTGVLLLFVLTAVFTTLALKNMRALEYATPCGILLMGYAARVLAIRNWLPLALALLLACQGHLAFQFYRSHWRAPPQSPYHEYAALLATIPESPRGYKVFHCEWEAGAFILHARPDLRFVDLLEPALLWHASQTKYLARQGLVEGAFADPRTILRGAFKADYVLCRSPALIRQMDERPADFTSSPGTRGQALRLFAVRPD